MTFVINPLSLILLILIAVGVYYIARQVMPFSILKTGAQNYEIKTSGNVSKSAIFGFILLLIIIIGGLIFQKEIRLNSTAKMVQFVNRENLPQFNPIRLTPKDVSRRYAEDSFQSPQEQLGDSQIVLIDGKLKRVFPRIPDGWLLYFTNKMSGFVTVEVDTLARKVSSSDQTFKYSDQVGIFDNIYYRLALKRYFVNYSSEPIYLKDDQGQWLTVIPYMTYTGLFFRLPQWGGIMVVYPDGTINDLTPQEAAEKPYFSGNRLYPKELADYYAESYAYRDGLINKWFLHKDQTEVVNLPNNENILHVATTEGLKEMVVAEPYGRSYGIYKIFFFDSTTGKAEVVSYSQTSQLTGPIAAADYIRKEFPSYDWSSFVLSEPRPINVDGTLYWLLSIIPDDSAGIAGTVLLNTKTNEVVRINSELDLQTFLIGQPIVPTTDTQVPQSQDVNIQIRNKIDAIEQQLNELKALVK